MSEDEADCSRGNSQYAGQAVGRKGSETSILGLKQRGCLEGGLKYGRIRNLLGGSWCALPFPKNPASKELSDANPVSAIFSAIAKSVP